MAIELRIAGPGLDVVRVLAEGEPELVLGREADCGVCLPDPERGVSRRHLSLWLDGGELHFHVLSVVNGVEMPFGEAPPGARGVLPPGQVLKLADYTVTASAVTEAETPADPWSVFDREGSGAAPTTAAMQASLASGQAGGFAAGPEEDPFGEWGFETGQEPGAARPVVPQHAASAVSGNLASFFQGLGLDPSSLGPLSPGELEEIGKLVRSLMVGVLELHATATGVKQDLQAEDRTMVAVKDNNPLKTDWPQDTKLRYLFGGRASGIGFMNPERALQELLVELTAHDLATGAAARGALEATLKEFAPSALKSRLLGAGSRLFEGTRAWEAYSKYYEEQGRDMSQWTQRLLNRYFTEAYLRESVRIKRETASRRH